MSTTLKFRRGNTETASAFTGAEGELFVDTTKDTLVVHDGVTAGGNTLATESFVTTALITKADVADLDTKADISALADLASDLASDLAYELPIASDSVLGGVKIGSGLTINSTGVLSAEGGGGGGSGSATSADTFTIKDSLVLQQSATILGTVSSKSIIAATTQYTEYVSNAQNNSTNPLVSALNLSYGSFYSSYADIYAISDSTKIKELFAIGNTVRIARDNFYWDLTVSSWNSSNNTYLSPAYSVTGTNSPFASPDELNSYFATDSSPNVVFSSNLPIAQKNAILMSAEVPLLKTGDKLLINGELTGTPYFASANTIGTWDIAITSHGTDKVTFGSYNLNSDQNTLREILQVGNTVIIYDNTWQESGTYLVTKVAADAVWNSTYGMAVDFQYVSGTNYTNAYTGLAQIFGNYFSSISSLITPNFTKKYISRFAMRGGASTYATFADYDFLSIGDELSYIPATTAIAFKDDAGNNIKAITYDNTSGQLKYDGLVLAMEYNEALSSLWSINADPVRKAQNISGGTGNIISIGKDAKNGSNGGVAIGQNANSENSGIAIGTYANASSYKGITIGGTVYGNYGIAMGENSAAYGNCVAIGYNADASNRETSTAIGAYTSAKGRNQFSYAASNSQTYRNQNCIIQYGNQTFSNSGVSYIWQQVNTSRSTTKPTTGSGAAFELNYLLDANTRAMAFGTAIVMYKPTNDANNNDCKVQEIKFVVRTTGSATWALDTISTTTLFAGTGSLNSNWTASFELGDNSTPWLYFKVDKGSDSTSIGVSAKVEFTTLRTA